MSKNKKTRSRPKAVYHVRNWPEYDQALVNRGSITVWVSEDALQSWLYQGPTQRGAQFKYSDAALESMLTVKEVFHFTNRAAEGFIRSLFKLLKIDLAVPDHTTLSRRGQTERVRLPKRVKGPLHVAFDSSGLKVYGEGEWKVHQHGWCRRRTWRKFHLTVDTATEEVQAIVTSEAGLHDAEAVAPMLAEVAQPIAHAAGDGAYDRQATYEALRNHSPTVQIAIPRARMPASGNMVTPKRRLCPGMRTCVTSASTDGGPGSGIRVIIAVRWRKRPFSASRLSLANVSVRACCRLRRRKCGFAVGHLT